MAAVLRPAFPSAALLALLCAVAARAGEPQAPVDAAAWRPVFHDDFERADVGPDWKVGDNGALADGKLVFGRQGPGIAILDRAVAPDVRVEMVVEARPGAPPCDLSIALACPVEPQPRWGYLCAFGGHSNTAHQIIGGGKMPSARVRYPPNLIEPGRVYRIVAAREGRRVTLAVDGVEILAAEDEEPLGGPGFDRVGLVTWNGMLVHEVRVYERREPHPATPAFLQPLAEGPLRREADGRLAAAPGRALPPGAEAALQLYNKGSYREAEKAFLAVADPALRAFGVAWCVGHVNYIESFEDHRRAGRLLRELADASPEDAGLANAGRLGDQIQRMALYKGAGMPNSGVAVRRIVAIGPAHNPFHDKARFYEARFLRAQGQEGADHAAVRQAGAVFADLLRTYPDHPSLRELNGQRVPWGPELTIDDPGLPPWATAACELYRRQIAVLREWFTNRQFPDGQLGGGWGDDVEILRQWGPFAFISDADPVVRDGIERLCDGMWRAELEEWGFSPEIGDVEHAAEPSADTVPTMIALRYGDPLWLERNMKTCRTIRDVYTGIDARGYRRFKSSYYGGGQVGQSIRDGGDTYYNGRTMKHLVWGAWYGNPAARDLYLSWIDGWLDATGRAEAGKKAGELPREIWYPSGDIFPPGTNHWRADVGQFHGGPPEMINCTAAYFLSGDERYLKPDWIRGRKWDAGSLAPAEAAKHLAGQVGGLRHNLLMQTKEVLQTDRAGLHGAENSYWIFTGGLMNWRSGNPLTSFVSYDVPHSRFAALVVEANPAGATVWLCNLDGEPLDLGLRLWRLTPGRYAVERAPLAADATSVPDDAWRPAGAFTFRRRADTHRVTLAAREAAAVRLRLTEPVPVPAAVPDLAIADRDVTRAGPDAIVAVVHNVGVAPAVDAAVALVAVEGTRRRELARARLARLDAPTDLVPRTETVRFAAIPPAAVYEVVADPDGVLDELYEGNNRGRLAR